MIVYLCDISEADTEKLQCHLTDTQLKRYRQCIRPERCRQYLCSRVFYNRMKKALGAAGDEDFPAGLPHRPLQTDQGTLFTSLSHSGDFFAFALASNPTAVDLEVMRARNFKALADCAFNESTAEKVRNSDNPAKTFHECWAQHECQIKLPTNPQTNDLYHFSCHWEEKNGSELYLGVLKEKSESLTIQWIPKMTADFSELKHDFK